MKIIYCGNPNCPAKIRIPEDNNKSFSCPKCKSKHNVDGSLMTKFQKFQNLNNKGYISIVTTSFILNNIFFNDAYDEFKHIVKKNLMENKEEFVVRACLESEVALDSCWKHELIGLRPIEESTPFLSKQRKDWRTLIE